MDNESWLEEGLLPKGMNRFTFLAKVESLSREFKRLGCSDHDSKAANECSCRIAEQKCNEWSECADRRDVLKDPPECFGAPI